MKRLDRVDKIIKSLAVPQFYLNHPNHRIDGDATKLRNLVNKIVMSEYRDIDPDYEHHEHYIQYGHHDGRIEYFKTTISTTNKEVLFLLGEYFGHTKIKPLQISHLNNISVDMTHIKCLEDGAIEYAGFGTPRNYTMRKGITYLLLAHIPKKYFESIPSKP